jgi:hypothetical protein
MVDGVYRKEKIASRWWLPLYGSHLPCVKRVWVVQEIEGRSAFRGDHGDVDGSGGDG